MRLSYCTNVHPAEDLDGIIDQLAGHCEPVRRTLGADALGVGLWLGAEVAAVLAHDPAALHRLRRELHARGLFVVTLNAFPYGGFHDEVVKHAVYRPRWTDRARLDYTLHCAEVLTALLPDDAGYGSISTLPLGWREPWTAQDDALARRHFDELARRLGELEGRTGRRIRIAVEPEPGCVLDTVTDTVRWLAGSADTDHIGLCLDTCHLAVSFAEPATTLAAIHRAGLDVVKIQASAALHVAEPHQPEVRAELARYAEPRYLHQVRELNTDHTTLASDDLDTALRQLPARGPWRVHFHVPLHWQQPSAAGALRPTTRVLRETLTEFAHWCRPLPPVEVETYTWTVLPDHARTGPLAAGIAAELATAQQLLDEHAALAAGKGDQA